MTTTPVQFGSKDYEVTQTDILYQGIFRLVRLHVRHRLFSGGWSGVFTREIAERFQSAAVIPYDPILDRVILIEQFRAGTLDSPHSPWQIEIPAGVHDHEKENLFELALRESQEEAGCAPSNLEIISDFFLSPGASTEYITIFYGQVDASNINGVHGLKQENEDIRVLNLSAAQAFEKLHNREVKTSPAIIGLQWLELNRDRLRENSTKLNSK